MRVIFAKDRHFICKFALVKVKNMKYQNIKASAEARGCYRSLLAESADIDSFVRSTGEALALYDNAWKKARVCDGDTDTAVAGFMLVGMAHLDALDMAGLRQSALATMLMMLVSVDMAGVSSTGLGLGYLRLHLRFVRACVSLCARSKGDDFASAHAGAILRMAMPLYAGVYDAFVGAYNPEADEIDEYAGMREAVARYSGVRGEDEHIVASADNPAEALVDMMSRLNAMGMSD